MKRILLGAFGALLSLSALATTYTPITTLNPTGSTAGQVIVSTGPTTSPGWAALALTNLPQAAANTVLGNGTASTAAVTALAVPSCSALGNALRWTSGAGFTCATGNAMTNQNLGVFAATTSAQLAGVISDETGSGSLVFATGAAINPTSTGATTPGTGAFTTLNASSNDALLYTNISGQSFTSGTAATVTTWTKTFDRANANFNASTGVFTAPAAGYYQVSAQLCWVSAVGVVSAAYQATIVANGTTVAIGRFQQEATGTVAPSVQVSAVVSLTAGQTLVLQGLQASGAAYALSTSAGLNFLSINRVP